MLDYWLFEVSIAVFGKPSHTNGFARLRKGHFFCCCHFNIRETQRHFVGSFQPKLVLWFMTRKITAYISLSAWMRGKAIVSVCLCEWVNSRIFSVSIYSSIWNECSSSVLVSLSQKWNVVLFYDVWAMGLRQWLCLFFFLSSFYGDEEVDKLASVLSL